MQFRQNKERNKQTKINGDLRSDIFKHFSFERGMMIEITELCEVIVVREIGHFCAQFLANFSIDLGEM